MVAESLATRHPWIRRGGGSLMGPNSERFQPSPYEKYSLWKNEKLGLILIIDLPSNSQGNFELERTPDEPIAWSVTRRKTVNLDLNLFLTSSNEVKDAPLADEIYQLFRLCDEKENSDPS